MPPHGLRPRREPAAEAQPAARAPCIRTLIRKDPVGRRWAALALRHIAGWSDARILKSVGTSRKGRARWEKTLAADEQLVERKPRTPTGTTVTDIELENLKTALTEGGTGQTGRQSLKRAVPKLLANNEVSHAREALRRALLAAAWSYQPVEKSLPLDTACYAYRAEFCRLEARRIALNTAFSDSKMFSGETSSAGKLGHAWAPDGRPVVVACKAKTAYRVHAYAAITRYGATPLYEATGTFGPSGRGRGRPRGSRGRARAPPAQPKGVQHQEYRLLLDNGQGGGMLNDVNSIFQGQGISQWRWQQDGAGAHSVANTEIGAPTRAIIEAMATLVEPWPSHSPDLSPIEKAWSAVEQHLWATMTWHDLATFKLALHASWRAVVTPAYCLALFGGLKATYSMCAANGGVEIRGWGSSVRAK